MSIKSDAVNINRWLCSYKNSKISKHMQFCSL